MTIHSLLTPDNCTVIFIDHQPQMTFGVTSIDRQLLLSNKETYAPVMEIVKQHAGAYGAGVEYAATIDSRATF